jgi:hypothetical protein
VRINLTALIDLESKVIATNLLVELESWGIRESPLDAKWWSQFNCLKSV